MQKLWKKIKVDDIINCKHRFREEQNRILNFCECSEEKIPAGWKCKDGGWL